MNPIRFSIVAAVSKLGGIGFNGVTPWRLPGDMKHFVKLTTRTDVYILIDLLL